MPQTGIGETRAFIGSKAGFTVALACLLAPLGISFASSMGIGPCQEDIQSICGKGSKAEPKTTQCLSNHESLIKNKECRERVSSMNAKLKTLLSECEDDRKKYCVAEEKKEKGLVGCLKLHADKISLDCSIAVNALSEKK